MVMGVLIIYKKLIAIFMLFLIVSLTPVFAYNYAIIYGSENIDKFIRSGEEFTAEVNQSGGMVYVNSSGELYSCECDDIYSICYCYFGPQYEAGSKSVDIAINESGAFQKYVLTYSLDSNAPDVSFTQSLNGNQLTIVYNITDTSGSDDVECSGVDNFKIFVNNYLEHTEVVNSGIGNCSAEGVLTFPIIPEPVIAVSIQAKDEVGNSREEVADEELTMDAYPPVILGSFDIMQGEIPLDKIALNNPQVPIVDVVVLINEENLVQVRGDLGDFNNVPIQNIGYENKLATCMLDVEINLNRCTFKNINLHPGDELISFTITAIDSQNNVAIETIEREYEIVNAENDVTHIGPDLERNCDSDGKCFIGKNTVLYVTIAGSADTSFRQMNVPIKISQLTSAYNVANPFTCDDELGDWRCIYTVQVDEANKGLSKYLYIDHSASDDYGKGLNGLDKSLVVIDMQAPVISEDSKVLLVNNNEVQDYCLTSEDTLTVKLSASEDLSTELKISASSNLTIDQVHRNDCVRGDSGFDCELDISNFLSIEETDKLVDVRVEDLAGNYADYEFTIDTCIGDMETVPTLVSAIDIGEGYNSFIDKRVASFKHWKLYIPLEFTLASKQVGIIDYEIVNCEAYDEDLGDDYVYGYDDSWYFLNKEPLSATASVLIGGKDIVTDSKDLICTIAFEGRIKNTYFLKKQYMNFTAPMEFFGLNIAGPDETIAKNIDILKDDIKDLNKDLEWRESLNSIMSMLCDIGKTMVIVNSVIQTVDILLKVVAGLFPLTAPASKSFHNFVGMKTLDSVEKYFWPAGNIYSNILVVIRRISPPTTGVGIKMACFLYNCQFYDTQELITFVAEQKEWDAYFEGKMFGDSALTEAQIELAEFQAQIEEYETDIAALEESVYSEEEIDRLTELWAEHRELSLSNALVANDVGKIVGDFDTLLVDNRLELATFHSGVSDEYFEGLKIAFETNRDLEILKSDYSFFKDDYLDPAIEAESNRDMMKADKFNFDTWIINPYKSTKYDGLCMGATYYNLKKEKELKCMHIKCLEISKNNGLDSSYCEELYAFRDCLYLESAQVHLKAFDEGQGLGNQFIKAASAAVLGTAISFAFQGACGQYYNSLIPIPYVEQPWRQWICAGLVIPLQVQEIISLKQSVYGGDYFGTMNAKLGNACKGIDFGD